MLLRTLIALVVLWSGVALAQTTSVASPPPTCNPPNYLGSNGTAWLCTALPAASAPVTITNGPGISVVGGPAYTVSLGWKVFTKTASYPLVAADVSETLIYNNATTPGTFTFLQAGGATTSNGTTICVQNRNLGALSLALATGATSIFYGGPITLNKDQSECVTADDGGNWEILTGVSPVIPNPNAFQ